MAPLKSRVRRKHASAKCWLCRRKKIKCNPEVRPWNLDRQQKCDACKKGGHLCGPNQPPQQRISRRQDTRSMTQMIAPAQAQTIVEPSKIRDDTAEIGTGRMKKTNLMRAESENQDPVLGRDSDSDKPQTATASLATFRLLSCLSPVSTHVMSLIYEENNKRLCHLGEIRELMEDFQHRMQESSSKRSDASALPYQGTRSYLPINTYREAIEQTLHHAHNLFCSVCDDCILGLTTENSFENNARFSCLLQLDTHLRIFSELVSSDNIFIYGEDRQVERLRRKVVQSLIPIYYLMGNSSEANRLQCLLAGPVFEQSIRGLASTAHKHIMPVQFTAKRMRDTFRSLNLPHRYAQHFPDLLAHTSILTENHGEHVIASSQEQVKPHLYAAGSSSLQSEGTKANQAYGVPPVQIPVSSNFGSRPLASPTRHSSSGLNGNPKYPAYSDSPTTDSSCSRSREGQSVDTSTFTTSYSYESEIPEIYPGEAEYDNDSFLERFNSTSGFPASQYG